MGNGDHLRQPVHPEITDRVGAFSVAHCPSLHWPSDKVSSRGDSPQARSQPRVGNDSRNHITIGHSRRNDWLCRRINVSVAIQPSQKETTTKKRISTALTGMAATHERNFPPHLLFFTGRRGVVGGRTQLGADDRRHGVALDRPGGLDLRHSVSVARFRQPILCFLQTSTRRSKGCLFDGGKLCISRVGTDDGLVWPLVTRQSKRDESTGSTTSPILPPVLANFVECFEELGIMNLKIIGCTHHESSLEIRERIAFSSQQVPAALGEFRRRFPETEAVLLSTCNRTELYTASVNDEAIPSHQDVADFLADFHGLDATGIFDDLFQRSGEDAIRHLFTVAASLDSMVVGEAQILSQVKTAYQMAVDENSAGQCTHSIFQTAMRVAKRVSRETTIHRKRVSIPSVAVRDFAGQLFERFDNKKVLLIGAGEIGEETLQYLIDANAKDITIVNRNPQKALALSKSYNGRASPWEELDNLLIASDLVITTTGASEPIVTREHFQSAIEPLRYQRPIFVLDLAVPRDFEPAVGECLGVYLYSIDDLAKTCERNRQARAKEWPKAIHIIDEETAQFMKELSHRSTGPTIKRLKANANVIKDAELKRLLDKLDSLEDRERHEISRAFDRLVNKLLHPPLESLRDEPTGQSQQNLLDSLRRLFQIRDE